MKRIFLALLCSLASIYGCSRTYEDITIPETEVLEIGLPRASAEYGKAVAKEIRGIIVKLNGRGYSFPTIKNKQQLGQFFQEVYSASSFPILKSSGRNLVNLNPVEVEQSKSELTDIQRKTIGQIIEAYHHRKSDDDFKQQLISINTNIKNIVPKIEQERLFNIISILYFSMTEIQLLEEKGMVVRNAISLRKNIPRLKSGTESSDGNTPKNCRKESSAFAIAIGYINSLGEKVASVVSEIAGGVLAGYIVTWCMADQLEVQAHCAEVYSDCMHSGNPYWTQVQQGTSQSRCGQCLLDCVRAQSWPCGFNF